MSEVQRFLSELKRRRVVRVAAVYAAAAFVIIQAADLIFPRIPLPEWTVALVVWLAILGLPVALGLAWAFDITPDGVQRTEALPPAGAEPGASPPAGRRHAIAGAALLTLVVLVALGTYGRRPSDGVSSDAASAHVLAVLPFEIRGSAGIEYLAEGMVDLLATKLTGVDQLRVVDARVLLDHVRRHGGGNTTVAAQAAARNFGARHFVVGSVVEFGGRMQLRASLFNAHEPDVPLAEASAQGGEAELFEMVDALAAQLLAGLSDGPPGRLARIAAVTTHSIEALRLYLAGEHAYRTARIDAAVDLFDRALRVDTTFALAAYRLATAAMWNEDDAALRTALDAAQRHREKLPSRERALVDAFTAYRGNEHRRAERLYRQIVNQYPNEVDGWYMLGELVFHEGHLLGYTHADALEPFERALALSPSHSVVLYHRKNIAARLGDTAAVLAYSERLLAESADSVFALIDRAYLLSDAALQRAIEARLPGIPEPVNNFYAYIGSRHTFATQPDVPRRLFSLVIRSTPTAENRALGHARLASFEAARGRLSAVKAGLGEARRLDEHLGWQELVRYALHPLSYGDAGALLPLRDSVAAWRPSTAAPLPEVTNELHFAFAGAAVHEYLIAALEVRVDPDGARRRARALLAASGDDAEARVARDLGVVLEAELAQREGNTAEALRRLETAEFWSTRPIRLVAGTLTYHWPVFLRAELLREAGRGTEAARWYRVAASHIIDYRPAALHRLCGLHEAAGETAEARRACGEFVALLVDADAPLQPLVDEARRRLARMEGR